ncbi:motility protein A [Carnobacterium antarcticum]|uniref:Motility protein A n=1 Tax=Carnobacterium antarcticum TaxID=2126436 RepID=A0ABW4NMB7_9LACT|nr:MotA/TolQ/ExbB proton channel family protein [Carnobacterium sp. CP1]ALV22035.1 Flagellar motor rotation protein MotA [Carnobacterium sp. CP1]
MKKNIVPLAGFILGLALIVWSITSAGELNSFLDAPSLVITLGGSFSALIISFPLKSLLKIPSILKNLLLNPNSNYEELIETFVNLSKKARSQGILSIEEDLQEEDNELLVTGLQMVIDGMDPETIQEILDIKTENIEKRHRVGQDIFLKWGELAPAYGMIGTLIGLIIMLGELNDPNTIGTGMATALITTLYGSFLANLVFLPIATNLQMQTDEEMQVCEMVIEGVLSIQAGQNPRIIEQKLKSYLRDENQEEAVREAEQLQREEQ